MPGVQWRRGYGNTSEQVPSAPLAPPQQLPIAEEGKSTAGKGASEEGASSQGKGRMKGLDRQTDPDMMEVWPPVLPETYEAPAAETGASGVRKATPRHHRFPPGEPISMASTAAVAAAVTAAEEATTAAPAVAAATATIAGTFPRLWGGLHENWRFSVSSPLCKADARVSASYADDLLAYAMRTVEAKRTVEEEAAEIERAHDSLLGEHLEKERDWLEELERRGALPD